MSPHVNSQDSWDLDDAVTGSNPGSTGALEKDASADMYGLSLDFSRVHCDIDDAWPEEDLAGDIFGMG